ncbi:MAG: hypothetical protein FWE02_04025 [Defluviitaleaceae bacterium]|nr:hypothetical protein [Defluviitaleaceae bacterium]
MPAPAVKKIIERAAPTALPTLKRAADTAFKFFRLSIRLAPSPTQGLQHQLEGIANGYNPIMVGGNSLSQEEAQMLVSALKELGGFVSDPATGKYVLVDMDTVLRLIRDIMMAISLEMNVASANAIRTAGEEKSLPNQGTVDGGIPNAPPVDAGKQGKHVEGHPNNISEKSQWKDGETGVRETQKGWVEGQTARGNTRVWDTGRVVGKNGETGVRVHKDSRGNIHGYPVNPDKYLSPPPR